MLVRMKEKEITFFLHNCDVNRNQLAARNISSIQGIPHLFPF